jgi:hypothetical protein
MAERSGPHARLRDLEIIIPEEISPLKMMAVYL